jgi:Peptidase family M1 domain
MLTKGHAQTSNDPTLIAAIRELEAALRQKDLPRTIAAWQFESAEARATEETYLRGVFSSLQVVLKSEAPGLAPDGQTAATFGTLSQITEPRGAIEQWGVLWKRTPAGWRVITRETFGGIDNLVHLTLQKQGFIATGQTIELEDFTLHMIDGTFFLNTQEAGPTSLVFVGKGRVTFTPRPRTEKGQMKIFAKSEVLDDEVSRAFLRIHPADLYRTLKPGAFVDDPKSGERLARATDYFERHKGDAFVLDAPVEGAPWWLLPGLGDATVAFDTKRFGSLTLSLSNFETEGVNLFNRTTQRQICVYPRADTVGQQGDVQAPVDVVHHDLSLSLNPDTFDLTGRDTLALDFRASLSSFRFHLDDDLQVRSVRSAEAGTHLFFRIRGQNSVLVSMGPLSGRVGRLNLTVEYSGRLSAGTVESEILQGTAPYTGEESQTPFFLDPAFIYSKRKAFYPQMGDEDYATSTMSVTVPADWNVVSGGVRTEKTDRTTRTITHVQAQDGKYLAFVVARLAALASERTDALSFDAYGQSRSRRDAYKSVNAMKSAARFYIGLFGPLPYSPLNLALVEAPVPGGHSPPGLLILQERPALMGSALRDDPATFYDIPGFFLAHELAHQWWGHGVTPRSYRDRWVAEGFAQYSAALWARESQGEEVFARVLRKLVTWARRMSAFGPVDLGNRVGHIQNNAQAHRAVVYDKGALVLDMIRRLIGDEAFRRGLLRIQREHRFERVDTETVRHAFEIEGSIDLDALFEVFVRNTAIPKMHLETHTSGQEIVVEGYDGPLPVSARVGEKRVDLIVSGRLRIPGASAGVRVTLDPDDVNLVTVGR